MRFSPIWTLLLRTRCDLLAERAKNRRLFLALLQAIRAAEAAIAAADGWERRYRAMYDAAPSDLRDGVLATLSTIEDLPEVPG